MDPTNMKSCTHHRLTLDCKECELSRELSCALDAPPGYKKLPPGKRCSCMDEYVDAQGFRWCCQQDEPPALPQEPTLPQQASLPTDTTARKRIPMMRGLLDYFPLALAAIAECSYQATQQHHPDKEMHWDRNKSTDHLDCMIRHGMEHGKVDTDGVRHIVKAAWRALAAAQIELEKAAQ